MTSFLRTVFSQPLRVFPAQNLQNGTERTVPVSHLFLNYYDFFWGKTLNLMTLEPSPCPCKKHIDFCNVNTDFHICYNS